MQTKQLRQSETRESGARKYVGAGARGSCQQAVEEDGPTGNREKVNLNTHDPWYMLLTLCPSTILFKMHKFSIKSLNHILIFWGLSFE